ncbi:hypothetical protein [Glycomyces xiaoerkulensis]|uniref:hypothetical protein n=1 Tax=Glycomyces xiaoerkulensis TaxID=2038139 RepID=UPI000C2634AE|nr:hypothetical protein [Glycomyces xiaoerkulensis]
MPSVDPDQVEQFAQRVRARHDQIDAYRDDLIDAEVSTTPFGGDEAPWAGPLAETWNSIVGYRIVDCDAVGEAVDKTDLNLLHVAAVWFEADGQSEADFNDTGASLAEHAAGEFYQDW